MSKHANVVRGFLAGIALCVALSSAADAILKDSIEAPIAYGALRVAVQPFIQAPRTQDNGKPSIQWDEDTVLGTNDAYARLQTMRALPDGSGRLAFNDIRGVLYLANADGSNVTAYLDLRDAVNHFADDRFPNGMGLLGFAFHPEFGTEGRPGFGKLYTAYGATATSGRAKYLADEAGSHHTVVAEWTTRNPDAATFSGTRREILRVGQFSTNHNVGNMAFNPAAQPGTPDYGALYISMGDGGGAFDPKDNGQDLSNPLAAILRIHPHAKGSRSYTIPVDNPFVDVPGAAPEIWAYGLRHVQHFSFASDGRLFLNDIGQNQIEEVHLGIPGANYGWNVREGTFATGKGVPDGQLQALYPLANRNDGFMYPIAQYDHDDVINAIGSGYLYEGSLIPELKGLYVFADLVQGRIYYSDFTKVGADGLATIEELRVVIDGQERPLNEVLAYKNTYGPIPRVDLRLGTDADGELYILTKGDGQIRKIVPVP